MAGSIFNESLLSSSKLLALDIFINDIQINNEDIVSCQIEWEPDLEIGGNIIIKDTYDLNNLIKFDETTTIRIYSRDIHDKVFNRTFKIVGIQKEKYQQKNFVFAIDFIDRITFILKNTFLSKGFTDTPANIINSYFKYIEIDKLLTEDKVTKDFEISDKISVIIPQDRSLYDFLTIELDKLGLLLYQTRDKIILRKKESLLPSKLPLMPYAFKDNTDNQQYGWNIGDLRVNFNNSLELNKVPLKKSMYFSVEERKMKNIQMGVSDVYSAIKQSTKDVSGLQQTVGIKLETQERNTDFKIKYNIISTYSKNNNIELVIPGNFMYSDIMQRANLTLKGNALNKKSSYEGDQLLSGEYFISYVCDRFVGDKLLQKYIINRIDLKEPR